jgi:tyrosyl-tRNA synthetase
VLKNVFDVFAERGFLERVTDEVGLRNALETPVTCYIGFDPTASSFHVGNLVQIMSLFHMQQNGHRPIALLGGGTGLVGDPSGKTEARQLLTRKMIERNGRALKEQLSRYLDFSEDRALLLNNAAWLTKLKYIDFLRDFGVRFSVNRMLTYESIRTGLERGLSFIEFNYPCLQAYDFWYQLKHYGCVLQMGGSDQWGNIVAGIDLIRRMEGRQAYGLTSPLIETADGKKMGKTEQGTVWLDAERTSPYEYYQFWINTDDRDVERFVALFTLLPMTEIRGVSRLDAERLNGAKATLAYEATRITHGREKAIEAWRSASAAFGKRLVDESVLPSSELHRIAKDFTGGDLDMASPTVTIPTTVLEKKLFVEGIPAFELFHRVGLCRSGSEARRLIAQGGGYINEKRINHFGQPVTPEDMSKGVLILRAGKKKLHRVSVQE